MSVYPSPSQKKLIISYKDYQELEDTFESAKEHQKETPKENKPL
jgi:hypothetical protein